MPGDYLAYLITFTCYGARVHGEESGSIDRIHNLFGSRPLGINGGRAAAERRLMACAAYELDAPRRGAVLAGLEEVCIHRGWTLLAAHVRTKHVHAVVEANVRPERVMNDFKAFISRRLNGMGIDEPDCRRWARHGSTRWLWNPEQIKVAIRYVIEEQGEPMAVYP